MSYKSGPVQLGTSDSDIFECPATFSGIVALGIANVNASERNYTLKFYKASTDSTLTIASEIRIAGKSSVRFPGPITVEAGDKIIGSASSATSVIVTPAPILGPSTAKVGLVPKGEWSAIVTYDQNDLVSVSGVGSFISMQNDNLNQDPETETAFWMANAERGPVGPSGVDGTDALTIVRVVSTGSASPTSAFEAGDTVDGVTLAANDLVLRTSTTDPELNGVYVVPASGAAARHTSFDAYNDHPGRLFSVMEGTAGGDTLWVCTSNRGGTIDVTSLSFARRDPASLLGQANTWSAQQTLSSVLNLTSGGIAFPATQIPSGDPNTLDDYEEGTWTPVFSFQTPGNLSVSYAAQAGDYTKIGRQVTATHSLVSSAFTHSTASGAALISGLPFACAASIHYVGSLIVGGITKATYTQFVGRVRDAFPSQIEIIANGSGVSSGNVAATDVPSGGTINLRGTVTYNT